MCLDSLSSSDLRVPLRRRNSLGRFWCLANSQGQRLPSAGGNGFGQQQWYSEPKSRWFPECFPFLVFCLSPAFLSRWADTRRQTVLRLNTRTPLCETGGLVLQTVPSYVWPVLVAGTVRSTAACLALRLIQIFTSGSWYKQWFLLLWAERAAARGVFAASGSAPAPCFLLTLAPALQVLFFLRYYSTTSSTWSR